MMKDLERFTKEVIEQVEKRMEEAGKSIKVDVVTKCNDVKKTAITLHEKESGLCPTVYVEDYTAYDVNKAAELICSTLTDVSAGPCPGCKEDILEALKNPEYWKSHLFVTLINKKLNKELLETLVYKDFLDLAIVYRLSIDDLTGGRGGQFATTLVNKNMLEGVGIGEDVLYSWAMENTPRIFPTTVRSMLDVLWGLYSDGFLSGMDEESMAETKDSFFEHCGGSDRDNMYVSCNEKKMFSANILLFPDMLEGVANLLDGDVVIIPSSVHECIFIKKEAMDIPYVTGMIGDVNESSVRCEEVLSDHPYLYKKGSMKVEIPTINMPFDAFSNASGR